MVRFARKSDLDALVQLEHLGFDTDRFSRRQFRYYLSRPRPMVLVEERGSAVIGMAVVSWRQNGRRAHLYSIVVHPHWRGRGIGKRLLDEAERFLQSQGVAAMSLEVRRDNLQAQRMYERFGYVPIAVVPSYYSDGETAVRYTKAFTP